MLGYLLLRDINTDLINYGTESWSPLYGDDEVIDPKHPMLAGNPIFTWFIAGQTNFTGLKKRKLFPCHDKI